MPAETITLTQDQAEDLRELLSYAQILEDWLLHAPSDILDELARFAYHDHFHPCSAAWWLIEDLGHLRCRLGKSLPGHQHEQHQPAVAPSVKTIAETETKPPASSRDGLDTATSIGNQNRTCTWSVADDGQLPQPMRHTTGVDAQRDHHHRPSRSRIRQRHRDASLPLKLPSLQPALCAAQGAPALHAATMMNARILVWNHGAVTSGQRADSADGPRTEGERMLAAYFDEQSVPWRYEYFGEGANPDFRADHPAAGEVVLEVYEPEYLLPRNPDGSYRSGAVAAPGRVVQRGLASRRKSRQAAVARDLGIPFVLVIASTNGELAIDVHDIPGALFGWPEFQWSSGADLDKPGRLVFGSGGRLQAHLNTRFSAVALITRGTADTPVGNGQACRLQVFHNPFAAIALKPEFAGPYDDQWAAVDSGRKYQLTGPD